MFNDNHPEYSNWQAIQIRYKQDNCWLYWMALGIEHFCLSTIINHAQKLSKQMRRTLIIITKE